MQRTPGPAPTEPEVRVDGLAGIETVVVPDRQHRPLAPGACPFCLGGLEAPRPYRTRWFPNRWPPLPGGKAEILLFSPDHQASLGSLGVDGVSAVLELWAERTEAQGWSPDVDYVLLFENRGAEVGATVAHPHGQLYAFAGIPPVPRRELDTGPDCPLCLPPDPALVVLEDQAWQAWVPAAASYPYELRIAPRAHAPDVGGAAATFPSAAAVIGGALAALDRVMGGPAPYMLWVHQRPTDGGAWPSAHLHLHVAPTWRAPGVPRFVAAGELGSGVFFNPVRPEDAAAALRSGVKR